MTSPSSPLALAVVGAGYWGPNLLRSSAASGRFEPRWVCDADPERAAKAAARTGTATPTTDLDPGLRGPERGRRRRRDARVDAHRRRRRGTGGGQARAGREAAGHEHRRGPA